MMIKDLELTNALDHTARAEIRGGSAYAGGQFAPQAVVGGGIQSPTFAHSAPINAPVAIDNDFHSRLDVDLNTASVFDSIHTGIFQ